MKEILIIIQIFLSIFLIASILLQSRGSGLGSAWGGQSESFQTRRGLEKTLYFFTIILSLLFFIIQLAILAL